MPFFSFFCFLGDLLCIMHARLKRREGLAYTTAPPIIIIMVYVIFPGAEHKATSRMVPHLLPRHRKYGPEEEVDEGTVLQKKQLIALKHPSCLNT